MADKQLAKKKIAELIKRYQDLVKAKRTQKYNEAMTRKDFILPLFEALGWDIQNVKTPDEVTEEEQVSGKKVDYAFRINGVPKLFLEAKAFKVDLEDPRWAKQAIDYAWHKSVTWAILTDFEGIKIFNAEWKGRDIWENRFFVSPKLICKGMFLAPEFTYDDECYYVGFSFSVIIQKDPHYSLKYLLGIMNSKLGNYWFQRNGKKRGVGVDIGVLVFRQFPVFNAKKSEQNIIERLVDQMLDLNKQIHAIPENSDKWQKLKQEVGQTDRQIDEAVYKLYMLTEEERRVVEGNT